LGDRFALQTDYSDFERLDLVQQFGDSPIVESVFRSTVRQWSGPVRSGYGWHLIYVSHREDASLPRLDEVRDKVKAAYIDRMKEKTNREKYDALQKGYIIERAYLR
jgi:parvulin-like peptidyl-prolyl isomerase